jgi:metal-responsive CopG/Arc/MetJ family transcriptional regulator
MRVVQMTLEEELVRTVDRAVKKLKTTRSAFTRDALREALRRETIREKEQRHRMAHQRRPARADEHGDWSSLQAWGDE